MKNIKFLAIGTLIALSCSAIAQSAPNNIQAGTTKMEMMANKSKKISPQKRAAHMAVDLGLNDLQRGKLQALFEKENAEHKEFVANAKQNHELLKEDLEALKKTHEAEIAKILGHSKFKQWKAEQAQKHENSNVHKKNHHTT